MRAGLKDDRAEGITMHMISPIRLLSFALFLLAVSAASFAQIGIGISVGSAPPPLPVYEQTICPGDGYIWTPGYWAWDADGDETAPRIAFRRGW
jgi:hypothetical protein